MDEKDTTASLTIDLDALCSTRNKLPFLEDPDDFTLI